MALKPPGKSSSNLRNTPHCIRKKEKLEGAFDQAI